MNRWFQFFKIAGITGLVLFGICWLIPNPILWAVLLAAYLGFLSMLSDC